MSPNFLSRVYPESEDISDALIPKTIKERLLDRKKQDCLRSLSYKFFTTDFASNDYLGFSSSGLLSNQLKERCNTSSNRFGSTGSRLLSGNSTEIENLEEKIAKFHGAEAALILNSGYSANLGLITSLSTRHDTILYDELSHASIIDAARSAFSRQRHSFKHNDLEDLKRLLTKAVGEIYVITESVFSMDGDFALLEEISDLCLEFGAHLIVDEAHAVGIFGHCGRGLICELGLESKVFARVLTFGKALGCHGAVVVGNLILKEFLVNFCRPFIYSTAPDFQLIQAISLAYDLLEENPSQQASLFFLIHEFQSTMKKLFPGRYLNSSSCIQGILIPGNTACKSASKILADADIDARAILSPTVEKGSERLRICLHSFNSTTEVQKLCHVLSSNGY